MSAPFLEPEAAPGPTIFETAIDCAERHGLPDVDIKGHAMRVGDMHGFCTFCAATLRNPDDLFCSGHARDGSDI